MQELLLKYGQKQHLEQLQNGTLYLKCIKFFKENGADDIGRLDKNENLTDVLRYPYFKGQVLYNNIIVGTLSKMNVYIPEHDKDFFTHISCFVLPKFDIKTTGIKNLVDKKMKNFGAYVLMIYDFNEFLNRVVNACKIHPSISKVGKGCVTYIDAEKYHGRVDIFNKFDNLSWQQEYRIAVQDITNCNKDFLHLEIGNIEDISILTKTEELGCEYVVTDKFNKEKIDILLGTKSIENFKNNKE